MKPIDEPWFFFEVLAYVAGIISFFAISIIGPAQLLLWVLL